LKMKEKVIGLSDIRENSKVKELLRAADSYLESIGYTEHGFRHARLTAKAAGDLLTKLDYSKREAELAAIAGYLHDIGNFLGRDAHTSAGALLAKDILLEMGLPFNEVLLVMQAISNHEEDTGTPTDPISAALAIADKADVHRSRVRNPRFIKFDVHDRVNYAVTSSKLMVETAKRTITLNLEIDTDISPVMEYFEIFLSRMVVCRRSAEVLKAKFQLIINSAQLI
jgi:metal-dependent HD superfamily phosphatase/phosphodiesterase